MHHPGGAERKVKESRAMERPRMLEAVAPVVRVRPRKREGGRERRERTRWRVRDSRWVEIVSDYRLKMEKERRSFSREGDAARKAEMEAAACLQEDGPGRSDHTTIRACLLAEPLE
jgi:hypothetical protein